jgi:molecular chaperone GrpE (heat shock protein)
MGYQTEVKLPKWPFFLGNAILLALAGLMTGHGGKTASGHWDAIFVATCGVIGVVISSAPYLLEYFAAVRLVETGALVSTVQEIRNLELVAVQINAATARWQVVQEHSTNSVTAAKEIAEKMGAEAAAFSEFLQKSNDSERANLRLEVEKLRRMENEWLQVIVRMLDHVYALYRAAERSGQAGLVQQLARFQESCRDVARRIGLMALEAKPGELFDRELHHAPEVAEENLAGAKIRDTLATGYTYQGRRVRPVLVELEGQAGEGAEPGDREKADGRSGRPKPSTEQSLL